MTRPTLALLALVLAAAPAGAQDPGALLQQAREALAAGRLDEALERVERALRARDDLPEPYLLRGHVHAAQGRLAEAVEDATEAIDLDPSRPEGYHLRGELFTAQGKLQAAIRDHEVALARDRRFVPARLGLGRALERALDYEGAQRHLEAALAAGAGPEVAHEAHAALGALLALRADPLECALDAPDAGAARALGAERLAAAADHAERAVAARASAPAHLGRARVALARGQSEAAARDVAAARALLREGAPPPLRAEVEALEGLLLLGRREHDLAARCFEAALRARPDHPLAAAGLAAAARAERRPDAPAAAARARALAAAHPEHQAGLRHLDLARRSGKREHARAAQRAFARALADNPLSAVTTVARGQLAARSRPADGLALVARACELDPLWVEAHLALGELLTRDLPPALRDGARAEAACTRALELTDDAALAARARVLRAEARLLRAGAAGAGPLVEEAARDLAAAAAALPPAEAEPVLRLLAAVRRRLGDEAGATAALAHAEQARAARDELVSAWLADAQRLRDRQDYSGAIALLDRALAVDPRNGDAYYERGTCYLKVGNFVPGILDFSRAVELDPRRADPVHRRLGQVARITNVDRVLAEMDRLVADHPDTSYVLFLRGMFRLSKCELERFEAEDVDLGLADLDRCLELNPEHVTALVFRAALRLRGAGLLPAGAPGREARYAAAMTDLGLALEKDPGSGVSHYFQGLCWSLRASEPGLDDAARADRMSRAVAALRAAVAAGYQVGERLAAERGFDALRQDPAFGELMKAR